MVTGREIVDEFAAEAERIYGGGLERIVVHGGWCRGSTTLDIDVGILLRSRVDPGDEVDRLVETIWKPLYNHGALLVVTPASRRKVEESNGRFWREMRETARPWDEIDLDREMPTLPSPVEDSFRNQRAEVVPDRELVEANWDLAQSSLFSGWLSRSIASGGKVFPPELDELDLTTPGNHPEGETSVSAIRRRQSLGERLVGAWYHLRYLGRHPGYDEAVRGAFRAVHRAVQAALLARTGRSGGAPRTDLPLAAHLLVRNGPLSENQGPVLLRLYLRSRLAEIWGTWGDRSLYSAKEADDALERASEFLLDVKPALDRRFDEEL